MKFAYYQRLSKRDRAVYDRSDAIRQVTLPDAPALRSIVSVLREGLERDDRPVVEAAAGRLALGLTRLLGVEPVLVTVLAVRPALRQGGELHGLYTRDGRGHPRIRVWMRTVHHKRVVAFKTFLRTLLHEVVHHLDFTLWKMPESFHTEGFFRRESSLFNQLAGPAQPSLPVAVDDGDEPAAEPGGDPLR
jgi:hypothetical protein